MDNEVRKLLEEYNTEFIKFRRNVEDALENIDLDNLSPRVKAYITKSGAARAGFEVGGLSDGAYARMFAEFKNARDKAFAEFKAEVSSKYATVKMLSDYQTDTSKAIAAIQATANAHGASISNLTEWKGTANTALENISGSIQDLDTDIGVLSASVAGVTQRANASGAFIDIFTAAGNGTLKKDADGNYAVTADGEYIFVKDGAETPISQADVAGLFISELNGGESTIKLRADRIKLGDGASVDNNGNLRVKRVYSDSSNGFYLKISTVGDTGIYQFSASDTADPSSSDCAFGVRHDVTNAINFYCYGDNFGGYNYNQDKFYPKGAWDFSSAQVSGLVVRFS